MADRFPLIVNAVSKKIEEIVAGDRLDLSGNGIVLNGDSGTGKYLRSDGSLIHWDSPGDVYLTQIQTVTNKTFQTCTISGSNNTITNIPNSALVNSGITINGTTIALGGTVTTPDNNTTYSVSAVDGLAATEKIIRLTSGGNSGAGVNDDVIIAVGSPASVPAGSQALSLFLDRATDTITLSGHVVDNDTITSLNAPGGAPVSGTTIDFTSTGAATVSMAGTTINIDAIDTDTKTKIRVGASGTYGPADNATGNFTFLESGATSVTQGLNGTTGDPEITISSNDTVTRLRGGISGTFTPATTGTSTTDVTISGGAGGNVTVTQIGNTIFIDSQDDDTITKLAANAGTLAAGDFRFTSSGATTITSSTTGGVTTFNFNSANDDTGAGLTASNGLILSGGDFQLKNAANLSGNTLVKWDTGNSQLTDSIISDDGSAVTISGDLVVQGAQTVLDTSILRVADNVIELRKGASLSAFNGGIRVNRTTDANEAVTSYREFQWYESGGYWRAWDGSVEKRFVTENETQVLTNKTLSSPTLQSPILGTASATSINGLAISSTASATFTVNSSKTLEVQNSLTLDTDNNSGNTTVNFRFGGDVVYKSDTINALSSSTSAQLRTIIGDTTGLDKLVFQTSPIILNSLATSSTGFDLINTAALGVNFAGAATDIKIGATTGDTTINHNLIVKEDFTAGVDTNDDVVLNGIVDVRNADLRIRGNATDPMVIGRGNGAVNSNVVVGVGVLSSNSSGSQNTGMGYQALLTNNSGAGNTAYGYQALRAVNVGGGNTAVGRAALFVNQGGSKNTAVGANALESITSGDGNVCIGYYAGYNVTGTGNVIIGPADSVNPINDATYSPPNASGDRQLVIGSGGDAWIKGDANFDVTFQHGLTVNEDTVIKGNLTVNGTTTTVQSNVVQVADKAIELAAVVSTSFTCVVVSGNTTVTSVTPTVGLIPGMVVSSQTAGIDFGSNCTIVSISGNTAVLSNSPSGDGTALVNAIGPSDTSANNGGLILNGTTNKTFLWKDLTDAWTSAEHMDLVNGKEYRINNVLIASSTQIGPTAGVLALGAAVKTSSLTSLGTLTSLTVSGNVNLTGTGYLQLPAGTTLEQPGQSGNPAASAGMLRYNTSTSVFEGYDGNIWGKIGGGAAVQSAAPTNANEGDLWYDKDDGRLFVYYNDGTSSQWVDASPNGVPTDLTVDGTTTLRDRLILTDQVQTRIDLRTNTGNRNWSFTNEGNVPRLRIGVADDDNDTNFIYLTTVSEDGVWTFSHRNTTLTDALVIGQTNYPATIYRNGTNMAGIHFSTTSILPTNSAGAPVDAQIDLGGASFRFANIYSADLQLSNEGSANDVDGTWGQYTIQEGEEDLFLINRRSGKKYKFMLQEVN